MQAHGGELAVSIPEMVSRWSDGMEVVRSRWIGLEHARTGARPARPEQAPQAASSDALERLLSEEAILLDRRAINAVLGEARP